MKILFRILGIPGYLVVYLTIMVYSSITGYFKISSNNKTSFLYLISRFDEVDNENREDLINKYKKIFTIHSIIISVLMYLALILFCI